MSARTRAVGAKPGPQSTKPRTCTIRVPLDPTTASTLVPSIMKLCGTRVAARGVCTAHLTMREVQKLENKKQQAMNPFRRMATTAGLTGWKAGSYRVASARAAAQQ